MTEVDKLDISVRKLNPNDSLVQFVTFKDPGIYARHAHFTKDLTKEDALHIQQEDQRRRKQGLGNIFRKYKVSENIIRSSVEGMENVIKMALAGEKLYFGQWGESSESDDRSLVLLGQELEIPASDEMIHTFRTLFMAMTPKFPANIFKVRDDVSRFLLEMYPNISDDLFESNAELFFHLIRTRLFPTKWINRKKIELNLTKQGSLDDDLTTKKILSKQFVPTFLFELNGSLSDNGIPFYDSFSVLGNPERKGRIMVADLPKMIMYPASIVYNALVELFIVGNRVITYKPPEDKEKFLLHPKRLIYWDENTENVTIAFCKIILNNKQLTTYILMSESTKEGKPLRVLENQFYRTFQRQDPYELYKREFSLQQMQAQLEILKPVRKIAVREEGKQRDKYPDTLGLDVSYFGYLNEYMRFS
ncbi:MAG: hypothetical protein ACXAEU_09845 [Candidatus Hodarchaeales archaeon]